MTLNEVLRHMLDERGVEWEARDYFEQTTQWSTYNGAFVYWARERDGKLLVETTAPTKCSASCTPEQAIAATLGTGTCHEVMINRHWRGCSECGYVWENMYAAGFQIGPNYCPMCGRRVEQ